MLTFSLVKIPIFVKITVLLTNIIFLFSSAFAEMKQKKNVQTKSKNKEM